MRRTKHRWRAGDLVGTLALVLVLSYVHLSSAGHCRAVVADQGAPSVSDVLEVFALLPGEPKDWLFPGAVARTVSRQAPTMLDPRPTWIVSLTTEASPDTVRRFYEAAIERSKAKRIEPPERAGRIVLQFRGGSVLIGRDDGVTFIVIVAEGRLVA